MVPGLSIPGISRAQAYKSVNDVSENEEFSPLCSRKKEQAYKDSQAEAHRGEIFFCESVRYSENVNSTLNELLKPREVRTHKRIKS